MEALDKDIAHAQQMIKNFPVVQSDSHLARALPSFSNTEQFTFEGQFKELKENKQCIKSYAGGVLCHLPGRGVCEESHRERPL